MSAEELLHLIALTCVPQIGNVHARALIRHTGSASAVFRAKRPELERIPGIGAARVSSIRGFRNFSRAEAELRYLEKNGVLAVAEGEALYPRRLLHCPDAPLLLFLRGNGSLNAVRTVSIVGTRTPTTYGRDWLTGFLHDLAAYRPVVVSGLAYGIDTAAHRQALACGLQTFGVLAHGLDRIYPASNQDLAREMTQMGGLVSEYLSGTPPDAQNFPRRNRIVAALSDAVVVVETGERGGSMITADIANGYHREVMALPGRVCDAKSQGCNLLIRENRAHLVSKAEDLVRLLNWDLESRPPRRIQTRLFDALTASERRVLEAVSAREGIHIDELCRLAELNGGEAAAAILGLEMKGLLETLPGKRFRAPSGG
jgi:DNA processing protein